MSGNVMKIMVKEGDLVETGQVLLILEAMKMKNEIKSTVAGIVGSLKAGEGLSLGLCAHRQICQRTSTLSGLKFRIQPLQFGPRVGSCELPVNILSSVLLRPKILWRFQKRRLSGLLI